MASSSEVRRGAVVLIRFPFSDLSEAKLRPAAVLADAGRGDFVMVQITSRPYSDPSAVELTDDSFREGSLERVSYARPAKLFTAHHSLIERVVGHLSADAFESVTSAVISVLRSET